jgi:hypothetical protein
LNPADMAATSNPTRKPNRFNHVLLSLINYPPTQFLQVIRPQRPFCSTPL